MNSLYQQLNGGNSGIKNIFNLIKTAKDPNVAMMQFIEQNPQMSQVMKLIEQNGGDPKMAFFNLAKEKGINPEEILSLLQ